MNAKSLQRNGTGSPHETSQKPNQPPQAGLSAIGQQILVGLLTRKQVAAELQTCVHTVARYTKRGLLPAVRIGRRVIRYKTEDLQKFIQSALGDPAEN